jgi:hypothetical protein
MIPNLNPELKELIDRIAVKNTYSGNRISPSIIKMFTIEETDHNIGVLVPYWLGVLQRGRGPRKNNKDHGLWKIIYRWMEKRNMFTRATPEGKISEAKSVTWYINKYGNKQFRAKVFVDIYETERRRTIELINKKFTFEINKITMSAI